MASWSEIESAEPEFAARVRAVFDAHRHKVIATLRADGSPRLSGIEVRFADGELTFRSMPGSRKGADLARDPRFALHSATVDPPPEDPAGWTGDAKVAGRAVPTGALPGDGPPGEGFRADLREVVWTGLTEDGARLRVEAWRPGGAVRRTERS
jgi:hypothetical protein